MKKREERLYRRVCLLEDHLTSLGINFPENYREIARIRQPNRISNRSDYKLGAAFAAQGMPIMQADACDDGG